MPMGSSTIDHILTETRTYEARVTHPRGAVGPVVLAVGIALALALTLMVPTTAAWAQDRGRPANDSFRVSWEPETGRVAQRIEGRVHNDSLFRVTDVRLLVEGLDADGQPVGRTFGWALGDIVPGGETSFVVEGMHGAVTYRIAVSSFDVVSAEPSRAPWVRP